jgi:hypothetical protein
MLLPDFSGELDFIIYYHRGKYMSSWANRNIPRKRNLSNIPEAFRPTIVPRVANPFVIQSETFQQEKQEKKNEVIYPTESIADRRIYPMKKIESFAVSSAIELRRNDQSYVFVILRHIGTTRDNDLWISSYNSIRKFYTNKIIIIDDNSSINTVNGKLINTEVIHSEWNGAGEILPYYYYFKHGWADRMIFLHDSMFLHRRFTEDELDGIVQFHWFFEKTKDSNEHKILTYLSILSNSEEVMASLTDPSFIWKGCFGATSIIDLDLVRMLENKYNLFTKLVASIRNRKDRETFERIFGIILFHEGIVDDTRCSNFGDILRYPKAFESDNTNMETAAHILSQKQYDTAIIKVWRGR